MKVIQDENLRSLLHAAKLLSRRYSHFNIDPAESDAIQHHCHAMKPGRHVCRALSLIKMVSREQR